MAAKLGGDLSSRQENSSRATVYRPITAIAARPSHPSLLGPPRAAGQYDREQSPYSILFCRESNSKGVDMSQGVNVLALVKDSERYIFLYDEDSAEELLQTLGRYASDKDLSFTWYDAAVLSQRVRRLRREAELEEYETFDTADEDDFPNTFRRAG